MRLQTVKSEVGRVLASIYKSNHTSQAGSDKSTVILGADAFMPVIVLYCVMKLLEIYTKERILKCNIVFIVDVVEVMSKFYIKSPEIVVPSKAST